MTSKAFRVFPITFKNFGVGNCALVSCQAFSRPPSHTKLTLSGAGTLGFFRLALDELPKGHQWHRYYEVPVYRTELLKRSCSINLCCHSLGGVRVSVINDMICITSRRYRHFKFESYEHETGKNVGGRAGGGFLMASNAPGASTW